MSIAKHARASQVVKNMKKGQYHSPNKWRGYGTIKEDIPSWDFRFLERDAHSLHQLQTKRG
jgi:hypothetical protein